MAEAAEPCRPFRVDELRPTSPQPGLQLFALSGSSPALTLDREIASLPYEAGAPLLLIPFEGGPARRLLGNGIKLERYSSNGANSLLIVVAGPSESCAPGIHAFDPATLERRWYLPSDHAWKPEPLSNYSMGGKEEAGLLAFRTFAAPEGAAASRSQLMLVRSTTGEVVWQRLVPSTAFINGVSGPWLLLRDNGADGTLRAYSLSEGRELWRTQLPERAIATRVRGTVVAAIIERSSSSAMERPERCTEQPCAFDLQTFDAQTGNVRWRTPLGTSEFRVAKLAMDGADVYVEAPSEVHGLLASRVAAFDLRNGQERWSVGPVVCASGDFGAILELSPGTLYSRTCDGVLRAISRADGRVGDEWGASTCRGIFAGDGWTLLDTAGGLARLDWGALRPARAVTVRGRVTAIDGLQLSFPRWVRIGSQLVRSDRTGRFRTRFTGRGEYSADLAVESTEPIEAVTANFSLDPQRQDFELELTARLPHW
jgi:outer membrane protein assembly factor BamB